MSSFQLSAVSRQKSQLTGTSNFFFPCEIKLNAEN